MLPLLYLYSPQSTTTTKGAMVSWLYNNSLGLHDMTLIKVEIFCLLSRQIEP